MEDKARVWTARLLAPVAFLLAATALVILVQRALRQDSSPTGVTGPAATVAVSTEIAKTTATEGGKRYYRIKAGDTLEAIASRFETTVQQLLQLNPGIDPLGLNPGQRVRVA
jgi:LysM repeat protein